MVSEDAGVDRCYKLLLMGESNVGKTSIILRYTENEFQTTGISTCGVDVKVKFVSVDNIKIKLVIWDTAGQERFRGLAKNYFRGANGFILVYDITNKNSFDKLRGWMSDAKEKIDGEYKMVVIGNKKDCEDEREVDSKLLKEFGDKNGVITMEVSAKTGEGVDSLFTAMVKELLELKNVGLVQTDDESEANKTYDNLNNSRMPEKKHNCIC